MSDTQLQRLLDLAITNTLAFGYVPGCPPRPNARPISDRAVLLKRARRFFDAVHPAHRERVEVFTLPDERGKWREPDERHLGLLGWILHVARGGSEVPERIPLALTAAYLENETAVPDSCCEACSLLLPIRPAAGRRVARVAQIIYFADGCPVCGGPIRHG